MYVLLNIKLDYVKCLKLDIVGIGYVQLYF